VERIGGEKLSSPRGRGTKRENVHAAGGGKRRGGRRNRSVPSGPKTISEPGGEGGKGDEGVGMHPGRRIHIGRRLNWCNQDPPTLWSTEVQEGPWKKEKQRGGAPPFHTATYSGGVTTPEEEAPRTK